MPNPYISALTAKLARVGIRDYEIEHGGKHPKLIYQHQGQRRFYVFPASGSDSQHGVRNAVADLRRHLGITAPVVAKSGRPKRKRIAAVEAPPDSFIVRPDPMLALLAWKPAPVPSRFRWSWAGPGRYRVEVLRNG